MAKSKEDMSNEEIFRPIISKLHQSIVQVIEEEEYHLRGVNMLLIYSDGKEKTNMEVLLFQTIAKQSLQIIELRKKIRDSIEEYLRVRGW